MFSKPATHNRYPEYFSPRVVFISIDRGQFTPCCIHLYRQRTVHPLLYSSLYKEDSSTRVVFISIYRGQFTRVVFISIYRGQFTPCCIHLYRQRTVHPVLYSSLQIEDSSPRVVFIYIDRGQFTPCCIHLYRQRTVRPVLYSSLQIEDISPRVVFISIYRGQFTPCCIHLYFLYCIYRTYNAILRVNEDRQLTLRVL